MELKLGGISFQMKTTTHCTLESWNSERCNAMQCNAMVCVSRKIKDGCCTLGLVHSAFLSFFGDSNWCMTLWWVNGDHHPWYAALLKGEKCKHFSWKYLMCVGGHTTPRETWMRVSSIHVCVPLQLQAVWFTTKQTIRSHLSRFLGVAVTVKTTVHQCA